MKEQEDKKFQRALIVSAILHLILLGVFFLGFPSVFEKLPEEQDVMTFEILPTSELSNVKNENIVAKKAIEPEKSKEVKKSATAKKQDPTPVEAKPEEKKEPIKEEEKPKDPEKLPEKQPIKKEEPEKKPEPKIEPKTEPKKEPKKETPKPTAKPKVAPKEEDNIDSILKNLEDESVGTDSKILKKSNAEQLEGTKKTRGMEYNEDSPLSITEKSLVKSQIEKNWRPPIGNQNLRDVRVMLHMALETDGTINNVTVIKIICPPNSEALCKLTAESAVRAVKQASPIENLPVDRYDVWKEFNLLFDPSFMDQ
jgi:outer membrane biosynthesis protein TonB